jgi:hypothetical protein
LWMTVWPTPKRTARLRSVALPLQHSLTSSGKDTNRHVDRTCTLQALLVSFDLFEFFVHTILVLEASPTLGRCLQLCAFGLSSRRFGRIERLLSGRTVRVGVVRYGGKPAQECSGVLL